MTHFNIRAPLHAVAMLFAAAAIAQPVQSLAQEWIPARPVRLLVPYGPGGSSDVIARALAAEMSKELGQSVVVENKAGGQGVIAMLETMRAAPDGYTLVLGHVGTLAVNPAMMPKLPYDVQRDFAPVTLLTKVPMVFTVLKDERRHAAAVHQSDQGGPWQIQLRFGGQRQRGSSGIRDAQSCCRYRRNARAL